MGKSGYCFCQIQACGLVKVKQNRYVSVCTKGFSESVENGFALRGEATKNEDGFPGNRFYDITNFWVVQQQVNELCDLKDRKSTRLNSSHGYISYAVFCLKKKKNNATSSAMSQNCQGICVSSCFLKRKLTVFMSKIASRYLFIRILSSLECAAYERLSDAN